MDSIVIKRSDLEAVLRAEVSRQVADRLHELDDETRLILDSRPADYFAAAWGVTVDTFTSWARREGVPCRRQTGKLKLYSIAAVDAAAARREIKPRPRRRRVVESS